MQRSAAPMATAECIQRSCLGVSRPVSTITGWPPVGIGGPVPTTQAWATARKRWAAARKRSSRLGPGTSMQGEPLPWFGSGTTRNARRFSSTICWPKSKPANHGGILRHNHCVDLQHNNRKRSIRKQTLCKIRRRSCNEFGTTSLGNQKGIPT